MQSVVSRTVRRAPRRIVPPLCVVEPSGMNTTTGCDVAGSNSVELAPAKPSLFLANSITAICVPYISLHAAYFTMDLHDAHPYLWYYMLHYITL